MLRARFFGRHDILRFFALCETFVGFGLLVEGKSTKTRNSLTSEVEVDNLEKFAKTSLVAEVTLDRLKVSHKKLIERSE